MHEQDFIELVNENDYLCDRVALLVSENKRLKEKCDKQATMLKSAYPEKSGAMFITGIAGEQDQNGMPEYLLVSPTYGVDFCYRYNRSDEKV